MSKPKAKQLDVLVGEPFTFTGTLALPAANSVVVTANHSGQNPGGDDTTEGTYTASPQNRVTINLQADGKSIEDSSGRQVFGRLTESSSVWTLSFFVLISGTETAHDFTGEPSVGENFEYTYFGTSQLASALPTSIVTMFENVDEIKASSPLNHTHIIDVLTIVSQNVIPTLSQTPKTPSDVKMIVNELTYYPTTHFTVSGTTITWTFNSGAGGFDIETTDMVAVVYEY